jgi:hypothetical protein
MGSTVLENEPSIASLKNTFTEVNNMANRLIDSTVLATAHRTITNKMLRLRDLKLY